MIELPRAALLAGEIAETAEFFSFGTNDLTQTTFGISRDDAASFLGIYTARGILPGDPFVSIDQQGVGELVKIGVERGRKVRPKLKVGICGEHGGDPASVAFCHEVKLDYVSCSPFRVPIARLAAAQAALGKTRGQHGVAVVLRRKGGPAVEKLPRHGTPLARGCVMVNRCYQRPSPQNQVEFARAPFHGACRVAHG